MENSIEEDIKILKNMNDRYTFKDCDICNNYNEKTKHCDKHKCMELQAIQHILSDYKRVLQENEKLKAKLLDTLEGQKVIKEETPQYIEENYISKEKIENKLKIRKEELGESKDSIEASLILREIYVLEELLESEK